jgi:phosphohistidine phosphatase
MSRTPDTPDGTLELILWRHAEAEDGLGRIADAKRRLTPRGEKQARKMAAWLRERLPRSTRVLVSPTERTQQTAHALGLPFELEPAIGPAAEAGDLLAAAGWPEGNGRERAVVLVGHQPTLGQLAGQLLFGEEQALSVRKGAILWFSSRLRDDTRETILRAVIGTDLL